jgi:phycoerythrin-associated linker protein
MAQITTLSSQANVDISHSSDIINQAYKQVFGNKHMMELDKNPSIEALFMNGDLSVQGLVTAMAQSDTYKKLFLEPNNPYRFVELNFKHLLGRPPHNQEELMNHVRLLQEEGYEAEICSYTYSDEYYAAFGVDRVPYNRANESMTGGRTLNYTRANALDAGYAGYDNASKDSKLLKSLCMDSSPSNIERKGVGFSNKITISWTSNRQVGANRRVEQRSVVSQTSMSATIKTILSQGGKIISISKI